MAPPGWFGQAAAVCACACIFCSSILLHQGVFGGIVCPQKQYSCCTNSGCNMQLEDRSLVRLGAACIAGQQQECTLRMHTHTHLHKNTLFEWRNYVEFHVPENV